MTTNDHRGASTGRLCRADGGVAWPRMPGVSRKPASLPYPKRSCVQPLGSDPGLSTPKRAIATDRYDIAKQEDSAVTTGGTA